VPPEIPLSWIQSLVRCARWSLCRPLLLAVDGLNSYVSAFRDAFRTGIPRLTGQTRRMTLVSWPNIAMVQVLKPHPGRPGSIQRVIVQGSQTLIEHP
jgi:hypothetical protein